MPHSRQGTSIQTLTGQVVFCVADTPYFWEDVILAAQTSGDWGALETEVRQGIACLRHRRAIRGVLAEKDVDAAAAAFREARQLYTAAETEDWLEDWGVTVRNWLKYIRRSVLRQQWADRMAEVVARYPVDEKQVHRAFKIVGICSGHLARFARQLAGRAAIHQLLRDEADQSSPTERPEAAPVIDVDPVWSKLLGLAPERQRERCAVLAELECSFDRFRQQVLTPEAIRRQISARYTDWIQLEGLSVSFADEAAAREAALCLNRDGEDLREVASRARAVVRPSNFRLEEVDPAFHSVFLSAGKGELLGPLRADKEYRLFLVRDKIMPSDQDSAIQQLAEAALLQGLVDGEITQRITWRCSLV
jgi:hypothetical protein